MWVAQRYPFQRPNTHITSGGLGAMGFAVPAAMGVRLARPDEPVWAISGDGGFQMNMAEIDRKSTRLNSSHSQISYAVFCLKKKKKREERKQMINVYYR